MGIMKMCRLINFDGDITSNNRAFPILLFLILNNNYWKGGEVVCCCCCYQIVSLS